MWRVLLTLCITLQLIAIAQTARADEPTFEAQIQPLVAKLCYECHGPDKKDNDLDLKQFHTNTEAAAALETWEEALSESVPAKPPAKATQPSDDERKLLVAWLDRQVNVDCSQLTDEQRLKYYKDLRHEPPAHPGRIRQLDPRPARARPQAQHAAPQRRCRRRRF